MTRSQRTAKHWVRILIFNCCISTVSAYREFLPQKAVISDPPSSPLPSRGIEGHTWDKNFCLVFEERPLSFYFSYTGNMEKFYRQMFEIKVPSKAYMSRSEWTAGIHAECPVLNEQLAYMHNQCWQQPMRVSNWHWQSFFYREFSCQMQAFLIKYIVLNKIHSFEKNTFFRIKYILSNEIYSYKDH